MKELKHEVITNGTPRIENMPKEVFNVFCSSLLSIIENSINDELTSNDMKEANETKKEC